MTCIVRIPGSVLVALVLVALIAAPPAAGAAPPEGRPAAAAADDGWAGFFAAPWRALRDLILNVAGADGTEEPPPPPPPPEEDDEMKPPSPPPTCPNGQTSGPCTDPNG